jgi:hypothetical protein
MAQNKPKQWMALDRALPSRRKFLREDVALGSATLLGGAFSGARGDGIGQGQAGASPYREPPPYGSAVEFRSGASRWAHRSAQAHTANPRNPRRTSSGVGFRD